MKRARKSKWWGRSRGGLLHRHRPPIAVVTMFNVPANATNHNHNLLKF